MAAFPSLVALDDALSLSFEVCETIAHALGVDRREVQMDADLFDDLGADTSTAALVILALEEAFDVDLEVEIDGDRVRLVSDVVRVVAAAVLGRRAP